MALRTDDFAYERLPKDKWPPRPVGTPEVLWWKITNQSFGTVALVGCRRDDQGGLIWVSMDIPADGDTYIGVRELAELVDQAIKEGRLRLTLDEQAIARIGKAARDVGQFPELRSQVGHAVLLVAAHLDQRLVEHWLEHAVRDPHDPVATALRDLMSETWNAFDGSERLVAGPECVREAHRSTYVATRAEAGQAINEILGEHGIG